VLFDWDESGRQNFVSDPEVPPILQIWQLPIRGRALAAERQGCAKLRSVESTRMRHSRGACVSVSAENRRAPNGVAWPSRPARRQLSRLANHFPLRCLNRIAEFWTIAVLP
jgi:hypothetical protein